MRPGLVFSFVFAPIAMTGVFTLSGCAMNPAHDVKYDKDSVHALMEKNAPSFRFCYERELKKDPDLEGKVVFEWTIVEDGTVKNARVKESSSTVRNEELEDCIQARIEVLKFPPSPPRSNVDVSYPFFFKK